MISLLNLLNIIAISSSITGNQISYQEESQRHPEGGSRTVVYTPNGTSVSVDSYSDYNFDFNYAHQHGDSVCSSNIRLRNATCTYNCHSYAWHKQRIGQTQYWMNDPSAYYNDGSYVQVTFSSASIGDKVCYFDSNFVNIHSGILVQKLSGSSNGICDESNLIVIESKWGAWGLYRSRGDETPYTSNHGGDATSIRFYRRHYSHSHSWSYDQISNNDTYHYKYCSDTGFYEEHDYYPYYGYNGNADESSRYIPGYICSDCGYITYSFMG